MWRCNIFYIKIIVSSVVYRVLKSVKDNEEEADDDDKVLELPCNSSSKARLIMIYNWKIGKL